MKILVAHNIYQQQGGEDVVVKAETALLAAHGHEVFSLERNNSEITGMDRLNLAAQTLWSRESAASCAKMLAQHRPDVLHVHNSFPLLSGSIHWAAAKAGVPVVQTLHNFRLLCPQAMFMREGRVCEDCVGRLPWRAAWHGCYRGSRAQSAVLASAVTLHRVLHTYRDKVARYIALNEFCRHKFIEGGIPAERIVIKPNFVDIEKASSGPRQGALFVGRLSPEKGLDVLLRALALAPEVSLRVAGTGPEAPRLSSITQVQSLGLLSQAQVRTEMVQARVLVMPAIWYETFGLVVVEAMACGLPVLASRIGVLPDLVQDGVNGLLFEPGDSEDLARKLRWFEQHPGEAACMGQQGRALYEDRFTPERNYQQLMGIYAAAMAEAEEKPVN
jgi:glycosyltransferase involved in cell wall biosynthesis